VIYNCVLYFIDHLHVFLLLFEMKMIYFKPKKLKNYVVYLSDQVYYFTKGKLFLGYSLSFLKILGTVEKLIFRNKILKKIQFTLWYHRNLLYSGYFVYMYYLSFLLIWKVLYYGQFTFSVFIYDIWLFLCTAHVTSKTEKSRI